MELEYNNAFIAPRELAQSHFVNAELAYGQGYRDRSDRKEKFGSNLDMEALHTLDPDEGTKFLREFYAKELGKYYLAADRESFVKQLEEQDG